MSARFVAEVSSNHGRELARCERFVDVAAEVGCAAVKFQQFRIDELFSPEVLRRRPEIAARRAWELPEPYNRVLAERARERGLAFASTPFYRRAVEVLLPHVDFFKLASYQLLWLDLLREVGATGRPVVLATGMATLAEVEAAVDALRGAGCADLTLLHCVSCYPTAPADANLRAIETLARRFELPVGWSDHTVDAAVVRRAVRRFGAGMVELHLDLDREGAEFAGGHCWLPEDLARVIAELREEPGAAAEPEAHPADGDGAKEPRPCEAVERRWRTDPSDGLRPLLAVRRELEAGGAGV